MKFRTVLLFGAPGSGKGTQGKVLGAIPGLFHFACGNVFRNLRITDPLGKVFIEYSSRGELVPDEPTIDLWQRNIQGLTANRDFVPAQDTLILDGIPRNPHQAEMLKDTLDVRAVIHLTCPDMSKMVERLQRRALRENRLDDANLEVIRSRLETYNRETRPVLDFYGPGVVHDIDATMSPVKVTHSILGILSQKGLDRP